MKELYAAVQTALTEDDDLITLLGAANIGQAWGPQDRATPCVVYWQVSSPDIPIDQATGNLAPSDVVMQFSCIAKDDDSATYGGATFVMEIGKAVKAVLNGGDLSGTHLHNFTSLFDDYEADQGYDPATQEWRYDLRFRFVCIKK